MRFPFPCFPAEFEIPDDWWSEAGMAAFTPVRAAFRSASEATSIALRQIEPPVRSPECALDWRGFDRDRMVSILKGFVADAELPPVGLLILPPREDISPAPFKYRVLCGFHRFYATIAAGFDFLPAVTREVCR